MDDESIVERQTITHRYIHNLSHEYNNKTLFLCPPLPT